MVYYSLAHLCCSRVICRKTSQVYCEDWQVLWSNLFLLTSPLLIAELHTEVVHGLFVEPKLSGKPFLCVDDDAHGILLYTENDYFYFSMHSSSLYSIFANWLCERPRLHEYYTSSVRCHTTSRLEPVFKLKGLLQGLGKLSFMTHLATSTVT